MFAPRSQHVPRTFSVYPTTSKKNTNKENAHVLPTKTPSRAGKDAHAVTGVRMGLGVKTEARDRNVLAQQGQAGKGKGRADEIEPKRLFASSSSKSTLPPSRSLSSMPSIPPMNAHKTPAPSRRTHANHALRTPAPQIHFDEPAPAPAPTPLPSATRPRRRSRQSLSGISLTPIKAQIERQFVTPAPVAWEEELSLGSIEEAGNELLENVQEEEEYGEPEYMPPPVEPLPWSPGWDYADVAPMLKGLSALPPMWGFTEPIIRQVPEFQFGEVKMEGLTLKDDDELEEEWLRPKVRSAAAAAAAAAVPKQAPTSTLKTGRALTTAPRSVPTSNLNAVARGGAVPGKGVARPAIRAPVRPPSTSTNLGARPRSVPSRNTSTSSTSRLAAPSRGRVFAGPQSVQGKDQARPIALKMDQRELEMIDSFERMMVGQGDLLNLDLDLELDLDVLSELDIKDQMSLTSGLGSG